ncbi:MAG: hypothetical protein ACR2P7_04875 [bacterium]
MRAWHIYYAAESHADARRLCDQRPNAIRIADGSATDYTVEHLRNDIVYTFLVEPHDSGLLPPEVSTHCDYVFHATAKPRAD